MASLRGITQLWSAEDVAAPGGASKIAHVGSKPYVAVFVTNDSGGPLTFTFQVATKGSLSAGKNEVDSSVADGGLVWYDYYSWNDPSAPVEFVAADGSGACFDLSPFAPELIRLVCVGGFGAAEVTASVTASGPN